MILKGILCCMIGYLAGNFSPAYFFGKTKGYDMRREGSGNVGATNAFIMIGKRAFFATAILDILKAFLAWTVCQHLFPDFMIAGPLAGVACVIGHIYPVFLGFHGGKGLASLGGTVLAWDWKWFFFLLAIAILLAFLTRYVCLVAPVMSAVFPLCFYWKTGLILSSAILIIPALPIFIKHWDNFVRISEGTEMRTSFIWDKEKELRRIGKWNEKTEAQLERREK